MTDIDEVVEYLPNNQVCSNQAGEYNRSPCESIMQIEVDFSVEKDAS